MVLLDRFRLQWISGNLKVESTILFPIVWGPRCTCEVNKLGLIHHQKQKKDESENHFAFNRRKGVIILDSWFLECTCANKWLLKLKHSCMSEILDPWGESQESSSLAGVESKEFECVGSSSRQRPWIWFSYVERNLSSKIFTVLAT